MPSLKISDVGALHAALDYATAIAIGQNASAFVAVTTGGYAVGETEYPDGRPLCSVASDGSIEWAAHNAHAALLAVCKDAKRILERLAAKGYLPDWDNKAIHFAIEAAEKGGA